MIKLCIFDLDGTVLDTIAYYGNYALQKIILNRLQFVNINILPGMVFII